jgi:hypothetical protein
MEGDLDTVKTAACNNFYTETVFQIYVSAFVRTSDLKFKCSSS